MLKAIVLDFNGVIVDDEHIHFELLRDCMKPFGLAISQRDYLEKYVVYRDEDAFRVALGAAGREPAAAEVERLVAQKRRRYISEGLPRVKVFPGVCEFVHAASRDYSLAIASGAARQEIEALLGHLNISGDIGEIVAAEDVERGKPEPDAYMKAVELVSLRIPGLTPSSVVAIEDTPGGVTAARRAGLKVAAVLNTFKADQLGEADLILTGGLGPDALQEINRRFS